MASYEMRSQRKIRQLFTKTRVTVDPRFDERTMRDTLKALDQSDETRKSAPHEPKRWSIAMNSKTTKIAVAAAILMAVLGAIHFLGGSPDGTSVVLAQAAKKMEAIHSYACRMASWQKSDDGSAEEISMQLWHSNEYGFRMEQQRDGDATLTVCMLNESNEGIRIWPQKKNYIRVPVSDEERAIMSAQENDPREWVHLFLTADYRSLGRDVIDGVTVEGVEVNDMSVTRKASDPSVTDYAARLWIDVETQLPVRIEEEYTRGAVRSGGGSDQFEWNPDLTTTDLEPDIPADYVNLAE
jgi:outer membrane lipoprotein-sorting protein